MEQIKYNNLESQKLYAKLLYYLSNFGLFFLCGSFFLYLTGVLEPHISFEQLSQNWGLPLDEFLKATKAPTGWDWTNHLHQGDYLSFLGMAILAGVTAICYFALIVDFIKRKLTIFLIIAFAEFITILFAASNLLQFAH